VSHEAIIRDYLAALDAWCRARQQIDVALARARKGARERSFCCSGSPPGRAPERDMQLAVEELNRILFEGRRMDARDHRV
jgi:hypothetical protein